MKLACPRCHQSAMSAWRKLALGAARSLPCRSCGQRVAVAFWPAMGAMLPSLAMIGVAWGSTGNPLIGAVTMLLGMVPYALLHLYAVPLVQR